MIITCPACETRFLVDDATLGGAGRRRLRCANCGNVWASGASSPAETTGSADPLPEPAAKAPREPVLVEPAAPEPPAPPPLRTEARIDDDGNDAAAPALGPAVLPRPTEAAVPPSQQPGHSMAAIGLIVVACLIIVLVAIFATAAARDRVVAVWDRARHALLAQSQVPPPPPVPAPSAQAADGATDAKLGAGLKVTVVPKRDGDSLVIDGDIVNSAPEPRPVPHLRLTLRDSGKTELVSKVIDPPVGKLAPGATEHFNTVFPHPSIAASKVDVTFATD